MTFELKYNQWANSRLIKNLKPHEETLKDELKISFRSLFNLLAHLHYYDLKQFLKLTHQASTTAETINTYTTSKLFNEIQLLSQQWLDWIESRANQNKLSNEESRALSQLMSHSNYHRGQIMAALSLMGEEPKSLDVYLYSKMA